MKCARCGLQIAAPPCPRCLLLAPIDETRFGPHFVLGEELGKGGMGTVLRARDTRIDRDCALKLLDVRVGDEAKTLAKLRHPGIVTLYEAGEVDGQSYIAMELVEGHTLQTRLPLPPREAVRIGIALCDALACAHDAGIVHRDIKPSNVLVTLTGGVKLTDFGIATVEATPQVRAATPGFAPPELAVTPKSDLFSLGVLVFQCVTGELPAGDMKRLPWPLDGVVRRATAQDPALRFFDAREMKRALEDTARAMDAASLPPDEENWVRAVALLFTAAAGVGLWTLLQSISPVIVDGENVYPLARMSLRKLADGRFVSLARLEVGPALATLASFAVAFFAYGLLRRHWRLMGLEEPRPDRPVPQSQQVMRIALMACGVFAVRRVAMAFGYATVALYVPVLGGMLELLILYGLSLALLECVRTQRPVTREWRMWVAFWIALLLPGLELLTYISSLEFS